MRRKVKRNQKDKKKITANSSFCGSKRANMGDEDAAANRPPNCRLFLGNLASEKTSRAELMEIFGKYGNIIEEIIMRRSFGFIQYDSPEAALAALQHEQGRSIGGLRVGIHIRSIWIVPALVQFRSA
jgi:RNA recognition motif-containing protein